MRLKSELRPYQTRAHAYLLSRKRAGLFLDMGLGKTVATLMALLDFKLQGARPALVVGPIRVIETVWRQEAENWEHLRGRLSFSLIRGNADQRMAALKQPADVYLINPEHLEWLIDNMPLSWFGTLVIDESSMFKSVSTKRFKLLRNRLQQIERRYILTGTPTPNSLLELWTQIFILDTGDRLGSSFSRFKGRFFMPIDFHMFKWVPRPGASDYVFNLIKDIVLRMDAADYQTLPKVVENCIRVDLPPSARKVYDDLESKLLAQVNSGLVTAANVAVAVNKCWQVANGALYVDPQKNVEILHNAKLQALDEILSETHEPVIVTYQFQHDLARLRAHLADRDLKLVVFAESDAVRTISDWNEGKIDVLLLHPQSGGHGINLQYGGHIMVFFSLTWSGEQYQQVVARLNRQGQTKPVILHKIMADHTVDDDMNDVLRSKGAGQAALLDALRAHALERELLS